MKSDKVKLFMQLAGQKFIADPAEASESLRKLGAQLLLSETLEYVIQGLGIELSIKGQVIADPNSLTYEIAESKIDKKEMLDGLADVAYTMYWNMLAFNLKLEEAFELVADNNLEKFVLLNNWSGPADLLAEHQWHLDQNVSWPAEVKTVEVIAIQGKFYGVGKDISGKVRKPSTYRSVDLASLI